jgi:Ion transport protein
VTATLKLDRTYFSLQAVRAFRSLARVAPADSQAEQRASLGQLTRFQQARRHLWTLLSNPASSKLAAAWSVIVILAILAANMFHIVETLPVFAERTYGVFAIAEYSTLVIFTAEIILTLIAAPNWSTILDVAFIMDVIVVIPSYMELILGNTGRVSLSALRVFRLLRVLRLFRVSRSSTKLVVSSVRRSLSILCMFIILIFIIVTIIGAIMHVLERGEWHSEYGEWRREIMWKCLYDAHLHTDGAVSVDATIVRYMPPSCTLASSQGAVATYMCEVPIETGYGCSPSQWDVSPFGSIPGAMWWALVTICTVGTSIPLKLCCRLAT